MECFVDNSVYEVKSLYIGEYKLLSLSLINVLILIGVAWRRRSEAPGYPVETKMEHLY